MKINFIDIEKRKIEYIKSGKGKDLLFLHGGSVSFRSYLPLINQLTRYFQIWAPSLPGAGRSSRLTRDWTMDDYADLVYRFSKQMKIKPIIAGHSLGGAITVKTYSKYADYFQGPVLMAPAGLKHNSPNNAIWNVIKDKFKILVARREGAGDERRDLFVNLLFHTYDQGRIARIFSDLDMKDDIERIKSKIVFIWAKKDDIFDKEYRDKFEENTTNKESFLFDAYHGLTTDYKEDIAKILKREFISSK